jgi:hypothetical protein
MARAERAQSWRNADELLEVARADTAHADLFLERARELLSTELSEAQWAALADLDAEVVNLTNRIANAMDEGDWQQVRELSTRVTGLKRTVSERAPIRSLAARVYGFAEILVDPFSPGISVLAGVPERELPAQRDAAVKRLERLRAADPAWADLYDARRKALAGLQLAAAAVASDGADASVSTLRARAQKALANGELAQLEQLSAQIMLAESKAGSSGERDAATRQAAEPEDLARPFAPDVCERAGKLGLVPHRVESTAEQVRARFKPTWRPTLAGDGSGNTIRLSVTVPGDAPEALRESLELLMNRAFVTSAGTRYMPRFVAEDVLVEDFDDPSPGASASSPLVAALGLPGRWGLSRRNIESALRARGATVMNDLGLDPRAYRVVCLPVDVYTRLGARRGWGKQEAWTHFDGYMVSKDRKLMALVGGDVRFGGLHDLVAVGADYDSDRLLARFAVVQRRRFATW